MPTRQTRRSLLIAGGAIAVGSALGNVARYALSAEKATSEPSSNALRRSQPYPESNVQLPTDLLPKPEGPKKRIAAITTIYGSGNHADTIITPFMTGYSIMGRTYRPHCEIVSLHIEQTPTTDIGRALAAQRKIPVFEKIADALMLGTDGLAVDGVLIVAEHGDYPRNEKEQQLYPRRELFEAVVDVFRKTGKSVPVFTDKHLSYSWDNAKWMYDQHRELGFAMMAGSSVQVSWRRPALSFGNGIELESALALGGFERDAYGIHCLEVLQAFVEHRAGAEKGVKSVQCLQGPAAWEAGDKGLWDISLLKPALMPVMSAIDMTGKLKPGMTIDDFRKIDASAKDPCVFLIEYTDGFRAAVYMSPNGALTNQFSFAAKVKGVAEPVGTWCTTPSPVRDNFSFLCNHIEVMFRTGKASYPVERTLLTTGILEAVHTSLFEKGRSLETPHLAEVSYAPVNEFDAT